MAESDHRPEQSSRRQFLEASIWVSTGGMVLALGLPGAAYIVTPILREDEYAWVDLGEVKALREQSLPLAVRFRFESWRGYVRGDKPGLLWVVPDPELDSGLVVLSAVCPHKGCNVSWAPEENLFACPCHRGRFDAHGKRVSGPPNRALPEVPFEVREGRLFARLTEAWV